MLRRPVTGDGSAARDRSDGGDGMSIRRRPGWLGPALIVAVVVFALRGFVFAAQLSNEHSDLLSFWLPRWAYLGRQIADLSLPVWNPYEMLGDRFAADPQSGWLYAPPMLLFSTLPASVAMRAMVVLHPLVAGLGCYGFLRIERLGRTAATVGAVSLAAMMSTSELVLSMPFAGTVAWTCVVLVAAAAFRRADRPSARVAWLALAAFAWSQVANAHLSHGLAMCSLLLAAYLIAHAVIDVRTGAMSRGRSAALVAVFLVALPLLSLAVLVPRFDAISGSSLAEGYAVLEDGTGHEVIVGDRAIQDDGVWAAWPLSASSAPGAYAGAVVLLSAPLALRSRRSRGLVAGVVAAFAISYVFTLTGVVTGPIGDLLERLPFGDTLVHNPGRLRILWVIALPILGAAGLQGVRDVPPSRGELVRWLGAGVALWLIVPLAGRGDPVRWTLFAVAVVPAILALRGWARRVPWAPAAIAVVVAAELVASSIASSRYAGFTMTLGLEGEGSSPNAVLQPLREPDVDVERFLEPGPFVDVIGDAPYLTWALPAASYQRGYLPAQEPTDWPALTLQRGTLFGIRNVLGYNPVQLPRYWTWIRTINELPLFYNAASVQLPTARDLDVMGVRYLIVPEGIDPPVPGAIVATDRGYDLVEVEDPSPLVSVVPAWTVVDGTEAAFEIVADPAFRVADAAVLEGDPGITADAGAAAGTATVDEVAATDVRIEVDARAPSIAVIRTAFDDGWHATVDGEPAVVRPVDGVLQGVAVEAGTHEIHLTHRDDAVAVGLWLSGAAWTAIAAAWIWARRRERGRGDGSTVRRRAAVERAAAERAPR